MTDLISPRRGEAIIDQLGIPTLRFFEYLEKATRETNESTSNTEIDASSINLSSAILASLEERIENLQALMTVPNAATLASLNTRIDNLQTLLTIPSAAILAQFGSQVNDIETLLVIPAGALHLLANGSRQLGGDWDTGNHKVGINTPNPDQPFVVHGKGCMTEIGGFGIKLTNQTGAATIKGQVVQADTANDDSVILAPSNGDDALGIFLDDGVADGDEAWVIHSGIAEVAMSDNTAATHGNWVGTSAESGYCDATSGSPPAAPAHFQEAGHCIQSVAAGGAGTHILARCIIHFN